MRGFSVRHEEHKKKARANTQTSASKFHSCYPSSKSSCNISEWGLMIYSKREKELVNKINFRGQNEKEKYIEM
eukprot:7493175-Ditylum_brightwellii.AAC.2